MAQEHGSARVPAEEALSARRIPFGRLKNRRYYEVEDDDLLRLRNWCDSKNDDGRFDALIDTIDAVLEERHG